MCLLLKGLFDNVLSDYFWARAVVLTSATVATVGLGLTIAADVARQHGGRLHLGESRDLGGLLAEISILR